MLACDIACQDEPSRVRQRAAVDMSVFPRYAVLIVGAIMSAMRAAVYATSPIRDAATPMSFDAMRVVVRYAVCCLILFSAAICARCLPSDASHHRPYAMIPALRCQNVHRLLPLILQPTLTSTHYYSVPATLSPRHARYRYMSPTLRLPLSRLLL